ncbi:hypothetical protein G6K93_34355 [Agrobacterium rhizogenes]|uniref:hypothetical protein n=1 Tax=Rhizobium rhizogenes TaxID=359 RepID=UPI00115D25C8|nr:hypothetical protein [Rhizobium rhizogenes]NTF55024.1 hypothetical protein [Rhizobium rhizogenes]NTF74604.1 hypothetical protein [Rhizobium rhizogenes]NTF98409.1 hypothetical protein [Rhizobium rhizogenes]NTH55839.1 hypothetical protein [Rhizobium rhizogenes]NTH75459.1 hypothetical protein [Rhizobium rhizogenes]
MKLQSGKIVEGEGYQGLVDTLLAIQAQIEHQLAEFHDDVRREALLAHLSEITAYLKDYLEKREIAAQERADLQKHTLQWLAAQRTEKNPYYHELFNEKKITIQTLFIGHGERSTLFIEGKEFASERTAAELLNYVQNAITMSAPRDTSFGSKQSKL